MQAALVGEDAHDLGEGCAAEDGHDEQGAGGFGLRAHAFEAEGKDGGEHDGHEEAGGEQAHGAEPAGMDDSGQAQNHVDDRVDNEHALRMEVAHEPCGAEAADGEGGEGSGEHVAGGLVADAGGGLDVGDEIAPGADLRADVKKLRNHSKDEVRLEEAYFLCFYGGIGRGFFAAEGWELDEQDEQSPEEGYGAEDHVGCDDAEGF